MSIFQGRRSGNHNTSSGADMDAPKGARGEYPLYLQGVRAQRT